MRELEEGVKEKTCPCGFHQARTGNLL